MEQPLHVESRLAISAISLFGIVSLSGGVKQATTSALANSLTYTTAVKAFPAAYSIRLLSGTTPPGRKMTV